MHTASRRGCGQVHKDGLCVVVVNTPDFDDARRCVPDILESTSEKENVVWNFLLRLVSHGIIAIGTVLSRVIRAPPFFEFDMMQDSAQAN